MQHIQLFNRLVQSIDMDRTTNLLKEMIAIKSENPFHEEPRAGYREKEMGQFLADRFSELGLSVQTRDVEKDRPNVFGCLKGSGETPALMLAGHMDTARTDGYDRAYDVHVKDGRIFGRGACDMKAALAAYLETVQLLKTASIELKGDLILAGIMDEEFQMLGSRDIGQNGPRAAQGIIGEPSDMLICPSNKGRVSTFIRTSGKAAHSSVPEKGQNAVIHMAKVLDALEDYNDFLLTQPPHQLCGHGRFNPGVIRGGVQVNTVPDTCSLEVDRRTLPGEDKDKVYQELRQRLDPLKIKNPEFGYDITEPSWLIPPNDIALDEPVVTSLLDAYEAVFGRATAPTAFVAGSDAPHMGFPTVICGPGSINQAHSTCEFVEKDQLAAAVKMYLWSILDLLF